MASVGEMNYNVDGRKISGRSNLAKIQMDLLNICIEKRPDKLVQFGEFMVTNPNMMDQPNMYRGLEKVGIYYKEVMAHNMSKLNDQKINMGIVR